MGDEVEAVVLEVSAENQRISLGLKQLTPNPWAELAAEYPIGAKITGKVRSVTDFGIFINVKEDIDGLVHVSDFSWTKKIKDPKEIRDLYKKGDDVEAVVLEIDPDNERLSLGIKQLTPDVWESVPQRYPTGAKVKGAVTSITDFGVFMELEEGVEGLIHVSQLGLQRGDNLKDKFTLGDNVEAEVINVDRQRTTNKPQHETSEAQEGQRRVCPISGGHQCGSYIWRSSAAAAGFRFGRRRFRRRLRSEINFCLNGRGAVQQTAPFFLWTLPICVGESGRGWLGFVRPA